MAKLLSTKYSAGAFNTAMLLMRLVFGILLMFHGYTKLTHFNEYKGKFMDFMGMGMPSSLALVIFAEFFCALFIVIGVFTRLATIPIIITMAVALYSAHKMQVFDAGEMVTLFLGGFITILILGPGRISVDGMISK
ncbi:MAG: DoxX family protein [Ferruginibacter sp.]